MKIFGTPSTFARQHSGSLLVLLLLASPVAAFCMEIVHKCAYPLLEASAFTGITAPAAALWGVVALYASIGVYHGAIAHRCGSILYHRWLR